MELEEGLALEKCAWTSDWFIREELKNNLGTVEAVSLNDSHTVSFWVIALSGHPGLPEVVPCNLPDSLKSSGTKIMFSGRVMDNPHADFYAFPIELTRLEFRD